jgi:two-component system LytT family response regulator
MSPNYSPQIQFVALPSMDGFILTTASNIVYCRANGNYTKIHLLDGTTVVLSKKLKAVEFALNREFFVRVHHSYLVNLFHAKKYVKKFGGQLLLSNGETIDVSRSKRKILMDRLTIV